MPRPKLDSGDETAKVTLRMASRLQERCESLARREGISGAAWMRRAIEEAADLAEAITPAVVGLFAPTDFGPETAIDISGVAGEGEDRGARRPAPEAAPSHPELRGGSQIDPGQPIVRPPTPEERLNTPAGQRAVELMGALEDSVAAAKAARVNHPETPEEARARRQAAAKAHRHAPMRAGMPVPRCECGVIRGLDMIWRPETRPEAAQPDASIDPDEEW